MSVLLGRFLMIGDVHLDLTYGNTSQSCNGDFPKDKLGTYGDYECDSPYKLMESSFIALNDLANQNNVDFIVWMG